MNNDVGRRVKALEMRHRLRRRQSRAPVYVVIGEHDPRPAFDGPVYRLIKPRQAHA